MTIGRQLIIEELETTLGAVSGVDKVYRYVRTWNEGEYGNRTIICVVPGPEEYNYASMNNVIRVQFKIDILCHVTESSVILRSEKLNTLLDDIIADLHVDQTRGGNAITTTILKASTDEADENGSETLLLEISVVYNRTTGAS